MQLRQRQFLISVILTTVLLFTCIAAGAADNYFIKAEESVGPVTFTMKPAQVQRILGKPDSVQTIETIKVLEYNRQGLMITFDRKSNEITEILVTNPRYHFAGGIHVGSTEGSITKAFGKPDSVVNNIDSKDIVYRKISTRFRVVKGKVTSIAARTFIE